MNRANICIDRLPNQKIRTRRRDQPTFETIAPKTQTPSPPHGSLLMSATSMVNDPFISLVTPTPNGNHAMPASTLPSTVPDSPTLPSNSTLATIIINETTVDAVDAAPLPVLRSSSASSSDLHNHHSGRSSSRSPARKQQPCHRHGVGDADTSSSSDRLDWSIPPSSHQPPSSPSSSSSSSYHSMIPYSTHTSTYKTMIVSPRHIRQYCETRVIRTALARLLPWLRQHMTNSFEADDPE
jgi:hypothetical protein